VKPRMFIASSSEHLDLAYAAQEGLEHDVEAVVWSQGVFTLSRTAMASLMDELDACDFGLFILAPSDVTSMRESTVSTVRDNVVFEMGLFAGRLGIERCFMIVPRGVDDLHLPTDLLGLTPAQFEPDRQDGNMLAALGPACNRVRKSVVSLGFLKRIEGAAPPAAADLEGGLCDDPDDCISLIQSWMGSRSSSENVQAIRYDDVDRGLRLAPGSARKFIELAARRWDYVAERKGKDTILFRDGDRV